MKIIKSISLFFSKIISKIVVVPISKLIYFINSKFDKPSKRFENWLSRPNTLLFVSLIMAVSIFVVIDQKILIYSESSAEVLPSHQVNVLYDEDNYVVEGIPEKVDITLIGNKADLYIAKQSPTNEVSIDLWGLKPGTHKVDIEYEQLSDGIKYSINPSFATVVIYEKVSATKTLSVDLLNQDSLDQTYIIDEVNLSSDSAVIKGASYKVDQVATVKALVDMKSLPKYDLGKKVVVSSMLRAYDENGNVVDVEISPSKVDVELLIDSPKKEVPIKVITEGSVIYEMGISSLVINDNKNTTVTVYGTEDVLANIDYIPVTINVDGLSESTQFNVELTKPVGIKHMSANTAVIDVTLSNDITNVDVDGVTVNYINLHENYGVNAVDVASIIVKAKGVTSIVQNITSDDIRVYVDLSGLGVGTHSVDIHISGNDPRVEYKSSVLKMKVKIYEK